jgi:phage FluMu gp28-like protein
MTTANDLHITSEGELVAAQTVIRFDPSQRRLFDDESRVIIVNWHRQKGKDFTAAAKAVRHALKSGQPWFIVSLTQRQADATFDKCKRVAKALMEMLKISGTPEESSYATEQWDKELKQGFQFLARTIRLPNGGSVTSLPGRDPDTLAGLTGNVIFTEFGLFPNGGYDHWRVVFPLATRGFQVIVISTPRGKSTKFFELNENLDNAYSVHFCDIHHSLAFDGFVLRDNDGKPTTLEIFKKLYGDASGFEREYECKFTGDASALLTWAELQRAGLLANPHGFTFRRFDDKHGAVDVSGFRGALQGRRLGIGWDVARRGHLSSLWVNVIERNQPACLVALFVMHNCTFEFMRQVVIAMMDLSRQSVGFGDATGLGMESNEVLQKKYGDRWHPFTFTATGKREVASALKTAFNDGTQTLPPLDGPYKFVATDLYAIQKDDTGASLTLSEGVNPLLEESHCDIAYSGGLSLLAGASNVYTPVRAPLASKPAGW